MIPITVVILARDEEENIGRALASTHGFHRVLVLDSGSRDKTREIAQQLGAEVMVVDWPGFAAQRRRAIAMATTEWILFLDADEALDQDLRQAIFNLAPPEGTDGYYLRRKNYFLGRPMNCARWEDDRQLRLFRRSAANIPEVLVHEGVSVDGRTERLGSGFIQHYTAPSIRRYLGKLNDYSTLEAKEKLKQNRRAGPAKMVFDLLSEFWKVYVYHQGWRQGWRGYALAHLTALYKFITDAKLWEARHVR